MRVTFVTARHFIHSFTGAVQWVPVGAKSLNISFDGYIVFMGLWCLLYRS